MTPRVVLDANIYASAFINPMGPPGRIFQKFLENGAFTLITSSPIQEEVRRCLRYPKVRKLILSSDQEIEEMLQFLELDSEIVKDVEYKNIFISDPNDKIYLQAALVGKASFIVSGDQDLLKLKEWETIKIIKPRVFLDLLLL